MSVCATMLCGPASDGQEDYQHSERHVRRRCDCSVMRVIVVLLHADSEGDF